MQIRNKFVDIKVVYMRKFLLLLGISLSTSSIGFAEPLAVLNINTNQTLKWELVTPSVGTQTIVSNSFGKVGNHIVFGSFTGSGPEQLGTIAEENNGTATWTVMNQSGQELGDFSFGNNSNIFVAGADFDNNGVIDPAVVDFSGTSLNWRVKINGFAGGSTETTRQFGKSSLKARLFYTNFYGDGDWIGFVDKPKGKSHNRIQLRNVISGAKIKINIKKVGSYGERPIPVTGSDGTDLLAFARSVGSQTKAVFINNNGQKVAGHIFNIIGTVLKGDLDPNQPGEELAVQNDETIITFNPFSKESNTFSAPTGIFVDRVNINDFNSSSDDGEDDGGSGGGSSCGGGTPGICGCDFLDETDGSKIGFVYKRKSDTYGGIVAVLANPCGREAVGVTTLDTDCNQIHELYDNGYGNPDPTGERHHFKETNGTYDGYWYRNNYGSVILKLEGTGKCYMIGNPATERID